MFLTLLHSTRFTNSRISFHPVVHKRCFTEDLHPIYCSRCRLLDLPPDLTSSVASPFHKYRSRRVPALLFAMFSVTAQCLDSSNAPFARGKFSVLGLAPSAAVHTGYSLSLWIQIASKLSGMYFKGPRRSRVGGSSMRCLRSLTCIRKTSRVRCS